jgi:RNase P subunit RPR2
MERSMMAGTLDCSVCQQPLPVGEPVAYRDKQQILHVRCYRPAPVARLPLRRSPGRPRRESRAAARP